MADYPAKLRAALDASGMTMSRAARLLNYDVAYLSRVANGKQRPSERLAGALNELLCAGGSLLLDDEANAPTPAAPAEPAGGPQSELAHMRSSLNYLLEHDNRYGGDAVASAAVQVWQAGQRRLDQAAVPEGLRAEYGSTVAEAAQIAGWLLYDADQPLGSRTAFVESHLLARQAGDRQKEWFALDMLAMHGTEHRRSGETLRISEELLTRSRLPPRVALLSRMRRMRALAAMGDRARAMADADAARGKLGDSVHSRDPYWTWWVNVHEVAWHEGEALLDLGDVAAAVKKLHLALDRLTDQPANVRGRLHCFASLLTAYQAAGSWRECENILVSADGLLDEFSSARTRRRFSAPLHALIRSDRPPTWLADLARDVLTTKLSSTDIHERVP